MKFTSAVLWSLIVSSAAAFGPKPLILPKTTTATAKDGSSSPLWRPTMNMAAGGAERAPEYYDGTFVVQMI